MFGVANNIAGQGNDNVSPAGSRVTADLFDCVSCSALYWYRPCFSQDMKYKCLLWISLLAIMSSCAPRKVPLSSNREIVHTSELTYMKDGEGRWYVLAQNPQSLKDAMKKLRPGPSSVDKVEVVNAP